MASVNGLSNDDVTYKIGSSTDLRYVGNKEYTFYGVPSTHPVRLAAETTGGCEPTFVSATASVGYYNNFHHGDVVYDLGSCVNGARFRFQCYHHSYMNGGQPFLQMDTFCMSSASPPSP